MEVELEIQNDIKLRYENMELRDISIKGEEAIDKDCLISFEYDYVGAQTEVVIETNEFTAVCPWTGLPDLGVLTIKYVPKDVCLELKSLKYYLLSFRDVGIVQEHAANRILEDLVRISNPESMTVMLDYNSRGGIHTDVSATYDGS